MEQSLRGALQALYSRHYADVTSLSCYLERQLPLREPFYQLKRVPHFQVRDDLHRCDSPAYTPILRLESATPEDVSQRGRAGCRRVMVEGDLGTGKTYLCYHLLQQWAHPPPHTPALAVSKTPRLDNITTFKVVIYLDCVRLPVSDYLARCPSSRQRHVHVMACGVADLLAPSDTRLFVDKVYDWLSANRPDVCVIYDNLDASDTWQQLVEETLKEPDGFGKIVVSVTPGRLPKKSIDSLFYCYGLHPDYSHKLLASKLKRTSMDLVERASIPRALDSSQELLRNPLTQSLLASYLKEMELKRRPQSQFDFIEEIVSCAMVGDSYPVTLACPPPPPPLSPPSPSSCPQSPVLLPSPASSTSLMSICETVAFECLESNTNYFCKYKFPAHFWSKHLCDCRLLHELHDVTRQGSPVVSFTSRCIRDYLASKRVCRYLLSDRDSDHFLDGLIHKRQFHSVVKFCIRHFVKLHRLDMVHLLLERLLSAEPKRWVKAHRHAEAFSRGRLNDEKEALSWLRETDFHLDLVTPVAQRLPAILELSLSDCPHDTVRDFLRLVDRAQATRSLMVQGIVLYMDGMFMTPDLGLDLARAVRGMTSVTTVVLCLRCVVDTAFAVSFLCEMLEGNTHVRHLTLEGPFNSAENLTPALHKRVKQVFAGSEPQALQSLCVEHVNYHHRVSYILSCWPPLFRKLELRKCNLDTAGPALTHKLLTCRHLSTLVLEHCHVLSASLEHVLQQLKAAGERLVLRALSLNLLSSARHFTRWDAGKPGFKSSLSLLCCRLVADFVSASPTLSELALRHDGIDDVKLRSLVEGGVRQSRSLTSLDLTGNVIGDAACEDIVTLVTGSEGLRALFLHENFISADVRRVLVACSVDREEFQLSL